jgi:transcriptional regulator with XRE-family HTH domain
VPVLLREKMAGRTQRSFAAELGVSPALLSLVLRGKYSIGVSAARRIVAAYPELRPLLQEAVMETPADRLEAAS